MYMDNLEKFTDISSELRWFTDHRVLETLLRYDCMICTTCSDTYNLNQIFVLASHIIVMFASVIKRKKIFQRITTYKNIIFLITSIYPEIGDTNLKQ